MFKTVQTDELVTATGGILHVDPSQIQAPKYNIKPPVWPRKVEGSPATTHTNTSNPNGPFHPHVGF